MRTENLVELAKATLKKAEWQNIQSEARHLLGNKFRTIIREFTDDKCNKEDFESHSFKPLSMVEIST